jgi:hypothetical protein
MILKLKEVSLAISDTYDQNGTDYIIGPDGRTLTLADLPPPDTTRWVVRRKAEVVAAVREGLLTREEALRRYGLSSEELDAWEQSVSKHGVSGLRTTRIRHYRMRSKF